MSSKSGKKRKKAASSEPFVAGWLFWLIAFVVLLVPAVVLARTLRMSDTSWGQSLGVAAVVAALGAGIVAWVTNTALNVVRKHSKGHGKTK